MKRSRTEQEEKTCEICGDKSHQYRILTCYHCKARVHDYCTEVPLSNDHEAWICENCQAKNSASLVQSDSTGTKSARPSSSSQVNRNCGIARSNGSCHGLQRQANQRGKVKFLSMKEVMKLETGRVRPSIPSTFSARPRQINPLSALNPRRTSIKSKYFRLRPPVKMNGRPYQRTPGLPSTSRDGNGTKVHRQPMQAPEDRRDEMDLVQQSTRHVNPELPVEADPPSSDVWLSTPGVKEKSKDVVSNVNSPSGRLHKSKYSPSVHCSSSSEPGTADAAWARNDPVFGIILNSPRVSSSEASWTGWFKFSGNATLSKSYGAFKAYSPARARRKAYEYSGCIDELNVELIPQCQLLIDSKIFKRSPSFDDIALFFYPDIHSDSSYKDYTYLRELMASQDYAIRGSVVDNVELLVFTSEYLQLEPQWLKTDHFLWGVFYETKGRHTPRNLSAEISFRACSPENPNKPVLEQMHRNELIGPKEDRPSTAEESDKADRPEEWTPPCTGWVKLNTSAIHRKVKDVIKAGIGGSVHGPSGKWVLGYVLNLGQHCDSQLTADLWALAHGLRILSESGYNKVQVETDSEQAMKSLKADPNNSDPNAALIQTCRRKLVREWQVSLSLVSKERNRPAAVVVSRFEDHQVGFLTNLDSPPHELAKTTKYPS